MRHGCCRRARERNTEAELLPAIPADATDVSEPTSLSVCSACATACRNEPARVTIFDARLLFKKEKAPGPADQIAAQ